MSGDELTFESGVAGPGPGGWGGLGGTLGGGARGVLRAGCWPKINRKKIKKSLRSITILLNSPQAGILRRNKKTESRNSMANKKIDETAFQAAIKAQIANREQGWGAAQSTAAIAHLYKHSHGVEIPEDFKGAIAMLVNPSAVRQRIEGKPGDGSLINKQEKAETMQKKFFSFKS